MAKIPNEVIIDFIEVVDHHKFKLLYRTKGGEQLRYPADGSFLSIEALDAEAAERLQAKIMSRINPFKR